MECLVKPFAVPSLQYTPFSSSYLRGLSYCVMLLVSLIECDSSSDCVQRSMGVVAIRCLSRGSRSALPFSLTLGPSSTFSSSLEWQEILPRSCCMGDVPLSGFLEEATVLQLFDLRGGPSPFPSPSVSKYLVFSSSLCVIMIETTVPMFVFCGRGCFVETSDNTTKVSRLTALYIILHQ